MRKGFTAIEMLVVLMVVAVVGAVGLAVYSRRYAPDVVCLQNTRYIGVAFSMYQGNHAYLPTVQQGEAHTGALGLGWLREGRYLDADWVFACPAEETLPAWTGTDEYLDALSRGFNRKSDRWHAGTLGYDYDNALPRRSKEKRIILADKSANQHGDGSVVLFADRHAEFVQEGATAGTVPNPYVTDTDIYQGSPGDDTDCYLNGPDTVDH